MKDKYFLEIKNNEIIVKGDSSNLINEKIGEHADNKHVLRPYEAFYLYYNKKAIILKNTKVLEDSEIIRELSKIDKDFWIKFIVYNDLRRRGFFAKYIEEKIACFLGYKGRKEQVASHIIIVLTEGKEIKLKTLKMIAEKYIRLKKIILLAIIDKEGDITYYEMNVSKHNI